MNIKTFRMFADITVIILFSLTIKISKELQIAKEKITLYERCLDRIYADNPDYYLDVFTESDEYCDLQNVLNNEK